MKQNYNFEIGDWLYIEDGNVEMLFKFLEMKGIRWVTDECYQIVDGDLYVNKGKFVITTNQPVVLATSSKIDEIMAKFENQNKENDN